MDCHKCPLNGKPTAKCIKCPGPSETPRNGWKTHVRYELAENMIPAQKPEVFIDDPPPSPVIDFMRQWVSLKARQKEIISMMITNPGISMEAIGKRFGITKRAVNKSLKKVNLLGRTMPEIRRAARI